MKTKNQIIVISETNAIHNKALLSVLCAGDEKYITKAEKDGEIIDLFNCDPDYIRINNIKIPFVQYEVNNVSYIVLPDYALEKGYCDETDNIDNDKLTEILIAFFKKDFKLNFKSIESKWSNFDSENNIIAYRGGNGYVYSLWLYKK